MKKFILLLLFSIILPLKSFSQQRNFLWTQEYGTIGRAKAEIEYGITLSTPELWHFKNTMSYEFKFGFKVGMNDRFDIHIFQYFTQEPDSKFKADRLKIQDKISIGEKDKYFIDMEIMSGYQINYTFSEFQIDIRPVFSKEIKRFKFALNPLLIFKFSNKFKFDGGYAAGFMLRIARLLGMGIEFKGTSKGHFGGFTITHGTEKVWVTAGAAFKMERLHNETPQLEFKILSGIRF